MQTLPIDDILPDLFKTAEKSERFILTSSPGSGKTTRVPPYLIQNKLCPNKKIIVLVPKRLAAVSAAHRVAEENAWAIGERVGYHVRFEPKFSNATELIYMTTGVFIKKIGDEKFWSEIGLIIFDEFHERSSLTDLALGLSYERQILGAQFKILVMSATLNVDKLSQYLNTRDLIELKSRVFPLKITKSKKAQRLQCDQIFADHLHETLKTALAEGKRDTLVFLPGLSEIRFVERFLSGRWPQFDFCILHGTMKLEEQKAVLAPQAKRRIILSTNVAESSLTVPSVDLVIDAGLEKKPSYEHKIGFSRLETARISLFSAKQRAGRAARTSEGFCYQLWHETDERSMPAEIEPEVMNSPLLNELLTLFAAGVQDPKSFSWVDRPRINFENQIEKLKTWRLVDENNRITELGLQVQSLPLEIERALLFIRLCEYGHQKTAARLMALIESQKFEGFSKPDDLETMRLPDTARRTEQQLLQFKFNADPAREKLSFVEAALRVFFKYFPSKIAQLKTGQQAISGLGRGVEIAPPLIQQQYKYFLLLNGRELSSSVTYCDFALGFGQKEFDEAAQTQVEARTEYNYDFEKNKLYKIERKTVGLFILSESGRTYLDEKSEPAIFKKIFKENFEQFFKAHPQTADTLKIYRFIQKQAAGLGLSDQQFIDEQKVQHLVFEMIDGSISCYADFLQLDLKSLIGQSIDPSVQAWLQIAPVQFKLPNGKMIPIDYESDQAPLISARIQEFFGQKTHPTIFQNKLRLTVQLLAPNYRPTQITNQLDGFWKSSYPEIRKELKARYPKHSWPEDPTQAEPIAPFKR